MRPRRRRSRSRRQTDIIFGSGGGLLLDSGSQGVLVATEANQDGQQQPFTSASENRPLTTGRAQTAHHAIPSADSQLSSPLQSGENASPSASMARMSVGNAVPATTTSHLTSFSIRSSSLTQHSSSASLHLSGSFTSIVGTASASSSAVSASTEPTVSRTGHPAEFYGGIAFIAVASVAFIVAIVAWLMRSRPGNSCCCGSRRDEDVENQGAGLGLGLYLDTPADGFDGQKTHPMPVPGRTRNASQALPPSLPTTIAGHPTAFMRPVAPHLPTENSVRVPNRLLGPLQVRNYVSGDFPSSSDEAVPSPALGCELGSPREWRPGATPRYLGLEGQGLDVPWSPLNIKKSRASNQMNVAQPTPDGSQVVRAGSEEQNYTLPTPPFSFTQTRKKCEVGTPDGWRDTLRLSIFGTPPGINGSDSHRGGNKSSALPRRYPRPDRWRTVLSSQKTPSADTVTSESIGRTLMTPKGNPSSQPPGRSVATFDTIGLYLRMGEQDSDGVAGSTDSSLPLSVSKKCGTKAQKKRRPGNVKRRTSSSQASSMYSSQSTKRPLKITKRASVVTQPLRVRPGFLRRRTAESVTSFSSETSGSSRALTVEELRAKRTLMLRARRKRGMGLGSGTRMGRLSRKVTHTRESPSAELSEE